MTRVYVWPAALAPDRVDYGDPNRTLAPERWDGALAQRVALPQRTTLTIEGTVYQPEAAALAALLDRISGGEHLVALLDFGMRALFGWDNEPALDAAGNELWRADGKTAGYAGEPANPPGGPYRSVFAAAAGGAAAGATALPVDGLLAGEVIPAGCMARVGEFRHTLHAQATADGAGAATLTLSRPLRAAVADDEPVRIPGDLFVGGLPEGAEVSPIDGRRRRTYALAFVEQYEAEVTGGFEWVVD